MAGDVICAGELATLVPGAGREMGLLLCEEFNAAACCSLCTRHSLNGG